MGLDEAFAGWAGDRPALNPWHHVHHGLLPVIGNLISNSVIVIIGLSLSLGIAAACLIFLILIHKLKYFVNAWIVGTQIDARA